MGSMGGSDGMRVRKNQKFRLKMNNFLEIDLRPVLRGIDDRDGAGVTQRVCDESIFTDGDERLGPNDEENAARRSRTKAVVEGPKLALEITSQDRAGFRPAQQVP